jgi:hypothetical protein
MRTYYATLRVTFYATDDTEAEYTLDDLTSDLERHVDVTEVETNYTDPQCIDDDQDWRDVPDVPPPGTVRYTLKQTTWTSQRPTGGALILRPCTALARREA